MLEHHLFRDVALATTVKLMVIFAAAWLVFGNPPKIDARDTLVRLIGTDNVSSGGPLP